MTHPDSGNFTRPPIGERLIAVASGKGGVGKTFLSITLAQALARRGARVLLFDGDLGLANVDVQLGLAPKGDLRAVISGTMTLDQAITKVIFGRNRLSFDVLAGQSGSGSLRGLARAEILALGTSLRLVASDYDHVLIDLGAGIDTAVTALASMCHALVVVATDEPTSLTDAYALIKVLRQSSAPPLIGVAINMAESAADAKRTFAAIARASGHFLAYEPEYLGCVRKDMKVRDAIRAQTPIFDFAPNTLACIDSLELADAVTRVFAIATHAPLAAPIAQGVR